MAGAVRFPLANGVSGMEIGTQSKYAFNILLDFKPEATPMRSGAAEILCRVGQAARYETRTAFGCSTLLTLRAKPGKGLVRPQECSPRRLLLTISEIRMSARPPQIHTH